MPRKDIEPSRLPLNNRLARQAALVAGQDFGALGWKNVRLKERGGTYINGWERAEQLARTRGLGALVVVRHATKGEMPRYIGKAFASKAFGDRPIVAPIALHQASNKYDKAGKHLGVTLPRLFTEDTALYIEKHREDKPEKVEMLEGFSSKQVSLFNEYIRTGRDALQQGGLVITAAEGRRTATIGNEAPPIASVLMKRTDKLKSPLDPNLPLDFVIVTASFDIRGVDDYADPEVADSIHLFDRFRLRFGPAYTKPELNALVEQGKQQHGREFRAENILMNDLRRISSLAHHLRRETSGLK